MWIQYAGPWEDVAAGRHVISSHRGATDDLTIAWDPLNCVNPDCPGHLESLRLGETEITEAAAKAQVRTIAVENLTQVMLPEQQAERDRIAALHTEIVDDLATVEADATLVPALKRDVLQRLVTLRKRRQAELSEADRFLTDVQDRIAKES